MNTYIFATDIEMETVTLYTKCLQTVNESFSGKSWELQKKFFHSSQFSFVELIGLEKNKHAKEKFIVACDWSQKKYENKIG